MDADWPRRGGARELIAASELTPELRKLVQAAVRARAQAHAPYSKFGVGAAALDNDLRLHRGCNVENSSYGLSVCAERVALFGAVAAGATRITAIAIAGPAAEFPTPPCGACRQVIWDLAGDVKILLAATDERVQVWNAGELLPAAVGPGILNSAGDDLE